MTSSKQGLILTDQHSLNLDNASLHSDKLNHTALRRRDPNVKWSPTEIYFYKTRSNLHLHLLLTIMFKSVRYTNLNPSSNIQAVHSLSQEKRCWQGWTDVYYLFRECNHTVGTKTMLWLSLIQSKCEGCFYLFDTDCVIRLTYLVGRSETLT